jgi:hypothetical protein
MRKKNINNHVYTGSFANLETGEILEDVKIITEPNKYAVVPVERIEQKKEFAERKQRNDLYMEIADGFTWSYISKLSELHQDQRFTEDEKTRIMFLGTYVSYSDKGSFLAFPNGRYIRKKNLKGLLELKEEKKFYSFYNKLLDTGIITEVPDTEGGKKLKWSEQYHFRGKLPKGSGAEAGLLKTYDKQIQELYKAKKDNGKALHSPKQLYTVFMVLPFVHYETNIICKNPNVPFDETEPLSIDELAKGLGFKRSNDLKRKMLQIELKEQPVFSFIQNKKATHITVNPFVVWRQNQMPNKTLMLHFFDTAKKIAEEKGIKVSMQDLIQLEGEY